MHVYVYMHVDIFLCVCVLNKFLIFFSGGRGDFMYATCPGDTFLFYVLHK